MRRLFVALATLALLVAFMPSAVFAAAPGNDNFANATVLTGTSGSVVGTTLEATDEANEVGSLVGAGLNGVWYVWTAGNKDLVVTFDTCTEASYDGYMHVFTGLVSGPPNWDVATQTLVGSNDDYCGSSSGSRVGFAARAGVTYWIRISGWSGYTGNFTLTWTSAPAERGTFSVTLTSSRVNAGDCTISVKGSNLYPGQSIEIRAAAQSTFTASLPGRWSQSWDVSKAYWSKDVAGTLNVGAVLYAADGYGVVIPKFVNRCAP